MIRCESRVLLPQLAYAHRVRTQAHNKPLMSAVGPSGVGRDGTATSHSVWCIVSKEMPLALEHVISTWWTETEDPMRAPRSPTPLLARRSPVSSGAGLLGPSDTCGRDQYGCKVPVDQCALCQGIDSGWNVTGKHRGLLYCLPLHHSKKSSRNLIH